jgi:hypothetical protein
MKKTILEHKILFGFISFNFVDAKRPKFLPNFVKPLTKLYGQKQMIC